MAFKNRFVSCKKRHSHQTSNKHQVDEVRLDWAIPHARRTHLHWQTMNQPKSTNISMRPGLPDDAPSVHALLQPFVRQSLLLERTEEEVRSLTEHSIVAEDGGRLIGFAAVEVYSRKLAEIQCLAVASSHQSLGVGKKLVEGCVAIAAKHEILELMAISSSDEFLQECGFDYSLPGQKRALFINP